MPPAHDIDLAKENDRLRKENSLLQEGREILKKATDFFAKQSKLGLLSSKSTALRFLIHRLCQIMDVTSRVYRA